MPKDKKAATPQARWWMCTWNNPPEKDATVDGWPRPLPDFIKGVKYSSEKGESGTPHWQGVIQCKAPVSLKKLKKEYPLPHLEPIKQVDASLDYVEKADTHVAGPWTVGKIDVKGSGTRNDLLEVKAKLDAGASETSIADQHFGTWLTHHKAFNYYRLLKQPQRDWLTECHVYWGPTRSGKSRKAHELAPTAYRKPDGDWWDGYSGQEDVVFDDFYGSIAAREFLKVVDRYPHSVPIKGGMVPFLAKRVFITSNCPPEEWYASGKVPEEVRKAIAARLTSVTYIGPPKIFDIFRANSELST